jgi:sialate O-acetylesterase
MRFRSTSFVLFFAAMTSLMGEVTIPSVLNSHMVLQRGMPVPVWGKAAAGEKVVVSFAGQTKESTANASGAWSVKLDAMEANATPQTLKIAGTNTLELTDILVGEVWLGSGQSNMQWTVSASENSAAEIASANHPQIRLFDVPRVSSPVPMDDVAAKWTACTPETVAQFSAALFFMGRKLESELKVPIGLIHSSWGGSRIEPWTPLEGFALVPSMRDNVRTIRMNTPGFPEYDNNLAGYVGQVDQWVNQSKVALKAKQSLAPLPERPGPLAHGHQQLVGTYFAMIHPLKPFAMRGAIWYQGESNNGEGMFYTDRMKALVGGWRAVWGQGDFPFYFVQIAPYRYNKGKPEEERATTTLAELWEAQAAAAREIPRTGMVVINDIGNLNDIHPANKQGVGARLAGLALKHDYGYENLVAVGPTYGSHEIANGKVRVRFENVGGGLASRDNQPLTWWEIAGANGNFVAAEAVIEGGDVVVSSAQVPTPQHVRFAWSQVALPNFMNKEGLPAGAFRF